MADSAIPSDPMAPRQFFGVHWRPSTAWAKDGGVAKYDGEPGREALRELLPYIALGWAPEWITGRGFYCGARAFARSLANVVRLCTQTEIPKACTYPELLKLLLSSDYQDGWRQAKMDMVLARDPNAIPQFETTQDFFEVDDFRYLLAYINEKEILPIKLRLGIIAEMATLVGGIMDGEQITSIQLCHSLEATDEPYPVMWLHNIQSSHWQSLGPRPSPTGLSQMAYWGLHRAAKDVVAQGLYRVTPESKRKAVALLDPEKDLPHLELIDYGWVYKHPTVSTNIYPEAYTANTSDKFFLGLTPRSKLHDRYDQDARLILNGGTQVEGYFHEDQVVPVKEYASLMGTKGKPPRIPRLGLKDIKTGAVRKTFVPMEEGKDMLDGINEEWIEGGSTSPPKISSSQNESSPPKTSPPSDGRQQEAPKGTPFETPKRPTTHEDVWKPGQWKTPKDFKTGSPGKRLAPGDDVWGPKDESPAKKPRTAIFPPANDPRNKNPVHRPISHPAYETNVDIQVPAFRPQSASNVRMFRAKYDSRLLTHGFFTDALLYRPNDLLIAIEPIPEGVFYPFWARTQDHREGLVAPGNLEEFLPKRLGESYLPFGLCHEQVVTPVPFLHSTYLSMGETYVSALREYCGVDQDAEYQSGAIKQIIEFRRREGVPVAFWKGVDAVLLPKGSEPAMLERYVRMVNYNSKDFHQDLEDGTAKVWLQDTSLGPRVCTPEQVVYHHDMNWGLRLRGRKTQYDLNAQDSRIGMRRILTPSFKIRPYPYPNMSLGEKVKHFVFDKDGYDNKLTPQQKIDHDFFVHQKLNGFDNDKRDAREVVALSGQAPRMVRRANGRVMKLLEFIKGDRIWMETPLGVPPYHGWRGYLIHGGNISQMKGFVYPGKVRDLRPSEKPTTQIYGTLKEDATGKALAPPEGALLGGIIDPKAGYNEGQWFTKKKPNSAAQLKAVVAFEEDLHKRRSKGFEVADDQDLIAKEQAEHKQKVDDLKKFSDWAASREGLEAAIKQPDLLTLAKNSPLKVHSATKTVITKWLATPEGVKTPFHLDFDDQPANIVSPSKMPPSPSPAPRIPTSQPIKPLIERTPGAYRRPKTGTVYTAKDFRRMATVNYRAPPKMGDLGSAKGKEKEGEKKKDGEKKPTGKRKATGEQGGSPSKTMKKTPKNN